MTKVCPGCERDYPGDYNICPDDGTVLVSVDDRAPEDALIGSLVDGRYRVESLLGVGGMGAVYRAEQLSMSRPAALKVLRPELTDDPTLVKRFLREVQAVSLLQHPNTIVVYDFGQSPEGVLYIAMEYLDGHPLADELEAGTPLDTRRALAIAREICGTLGEAHDKGIVHRDLKPDNVMILAGDDLRVKVLDFGVAKLNTEAPQTQLTRAGYTLGTPAYMAPEQAQALPVITPAADIYALGCILFECFTGRPPFVNESMVNVLLMHCTDEAPGFEQVLPGHGAPEGVEALVQWMLRKDPAQRPERVTEVVDRLDALLGGENPAPTPEALEWAPTCVDRRAVGQDNATTSTYDPPSLPRRPFPLVPAAVGALVLAGLTVLALQTGDQPSVASTPSTASTARAPGTAPPSPAAAAPRYVWVRSMPAGAELRAGDRVLGRTPVRVRVDPEEILRMELVLEGYEALAVAVDPGTKDDLAVTLAARTKPTATRRARKKPRRPRPRNKRADEQDGTELLLDDDSLK